MASSRFPTTSERLRPYSFSIAEFHASIRCSRFEATTPALIDSMMFSLKSFSVWYWRASCSSER